MFGGFYVLQKERSKGLSKLACPLCFYRHLGFRAVGEDIIEIALNPESLQSVLRVKPARALL